MVALGGFRILANPYTIIIVAIMVLLVVFRRQVSEAMGGFGGGLSSLGTGINSFVSSIGSPKIQPTIGLDLTGVFGDMKNYLYNQQQTNPSTSGNDLLSILRRYGISPIGLNGTTNDQPSGQTGGINLAQSTAQSTPNTAYTYSNGKWYSNI